MKRSRYIFPGILSAMLLAPQVLAYDGVTSSTDYLDLSSFSLSEKNWSATGNTLKFTAGMQNKLWLGQSRRTLRPFLQPGTTNANQISVDIKRQFFSRAANTYLAMGLGWDDIGLSNDDSTHGMRLVAEGRVGVYGPAYIFGQAALAPWMSDTASFIDPFGKEIELGVGFQPLPTMSFKAGYRSYWLDLMNLENDALQRNQSDGFYIGGGLNW